MRSGGLYNHVSVLYSRSAVADERGSRCTGVFIIYMDRRSLLGCVTLGVLMVTCSPCVIATRADTGSVCAEDNYIRYCTNSVSTEQVTDVLNGLAAEHRTGHVHISGFNWSEFPAGLFGRSSELQISSLHLYANISHMGSRSFSGLASASLRRLDLDGNRLTSIPAAALSGAPALNILSVNNNRITTVRRRDFRHTPLLWSLSLAGNRISSVEQDALPQLSRLSLGLNSIYSLNGTLRNQTVMNWLMLSDNLLTRLQGELPFSTQLTMLSVSNNRLDSLDGVGATSRLAHLFADSNRVASIAGLCPLTRLQRLHLSFNRLTRITGDDLVGCARLERLNVSNNAIARVDGLLDGAPQLLTLDLSFNQLSSLTPLMTSQPRYHKQNVRGKKLRETSLGSLNAKSNQLTEIGELVLPNLRTLDVSDNGITQVSVTELAGLPLLGSLDLSGNKLSEFSLTFLPSTSLNLIGTDHSSKSATNQHVLPHLQQLFLTNNSMTSLQVSLDVLPALCRLDVRFNQLSHISWHRSTVWSCSHRGGPVVFVDADVWRKSTNSSWLKSIVTDFQIQHTRTDTG